MKKQVEDWNYLYIKNQQKIWLKIYKDFRNWEKAGKSNPISYFTDGLSRWFCLEIIKERKKTLKEVENILEYFELENYELKLNCHLGHTWKDLKEQIKKLGEEK